MSSSERPDVVVIGAGLVGLSVARGVARKGFSVLVTGTRRQGFASAAAAGLLAPTIEAGSGDTLRFALAARDRYPSFLAELREETGTDVPLHFHGILRLPDSEADGAELSRDAGPFARWLSTAEAAELEPALAAPFGALWHHQDGMVDNVALLGTLERSAAGLGVQRRAVEVMALSPSRQSVELALADGARLSCGTVVIAAGAWASLLDGLPRPLPVTPLRGQMLALAGASLRRPVYAMGGYVAPRLEEGFTIAGSTSEDVGFSPGTTPEALTRFEEIARRLLPARPPVPLRSWSGLRPMTPDGLPILGPDPDVPTVVYACGHSRNGILMAPLTADVVAALLAGEPMPHDITVFAIDRFTSERSQNP